MADKGSKALAVAANIQNLPAVGSTITETQAVDIAKQIAALSLKSARAERAQKLAALGRELGGQISRLDDDVVEQGRKWAARIAAIAAKKKSGRNGGSYYGATPPSDPLDKIVGKIAAIIGELEGLRLVDNALGLFEQIDESKHVGRNPHYATNWREAVGDQARDLAQQTLVQYTIVPDEKPAKPNGKRPKNVTPSNFDPVELVDAAVGDVVDEIAEVAEDEGDGGE